MAYDNSNTVAIFKVDEKKNEKGPDYTGSLNVGGVDYQVSLWKKIAKTSGKPYLQGRVQTADGKAPAPKKQEPADDFDPPF